MYRPAESRREHMQIEFGHLLIEPLHKALLPSFE